MCKGLPPCLSVLGGLMDLALSMASVICVSSLKYYLLSTHDVLAIYFLMRLKNEMDR